MNVGDRITFSFAGKEKEGVVVKVFPKKIYLKVDFPNQPGKTVIRSLADLEGKNTTKAKRSKRREKAEKEKKAKQEKREKAQASEEKKAEEEKEEPAKS